ncbi:hypothetical protein POX_f08257 [Penicillium oxalicum]|uniref:Putative UDP-GalNAc:alpha-1,4-N-acetylgalactosaminyltransferase n=1 Tax=Penicillium oxalicum (strain 114-2 / CGMCC 5302) TaxID=933388 RepID=S7ZKJ7_PENO1|nr:hypothetical protein POX_f08257 [Penicillium oxalicum]EPS29211.1 putative UDP-GalNAc:alpha-1,4-N-acetylgalactosaminyltransferase [Penicillium oxalicum 114-2]KAI2787876.1 hypothetical protein POX_f08257 [Penicillium oxalicum]
MARGRLRVCLIVISLFVLAFLGASSIQRLYQLLRLPFVWYGSAVYATISQQHDHFDLTFESYGANYSVQDDGFRPLIPARMHHIHLGPNPPKPEWIAARSDCLRQHESWEFFLWNDNNAPQFVEANYPHLYEMWKNYPFVVQRVDALRYMTLKTYGGAVLDFDLACKRSMEPLRRFEFVAPAAHPAGFSIGMMLASQNNTFVNSLVESLPRFNHVFPLLPYVTVMFSTGCHYASTVFTLQKERAKYRILSGTLNQPNLHMLNGYVNTPLFRHLGSSSWHAGDARLILKLKNTPPKYIALAAVIAITVLATLICCMCSLRHRLRSRRDVESLARSSPSKSSCKDT